MPIINMASSEAEALSKGTNVRLLKDNSASSPIWLYDSHIGLCINDREMNGYDDSDWYMTVWNNEKNAPEEIMFATTRGWTYPCYGSAPDATPEIMEKYDAWREVKRLEAKAAREAIEAATPYVGKTVVVTAGRKVPKGTEAIVRWYGVGRAFSYYESKNPTMRVGIQTANGTMYYTAASNVTVI